MADTEHENVELARKIWHAASTGDVETLTELSADELVWHASGRGPRAGDYYGRDAVFEYVGSIGEDADRFDSTLEHVLCGGPLVALLVRVEARRGDKELQTGLVVIYRMHKGQLAEVWSIARDQHALDEFWT